MNNLLRYLLLPFSWLYGLGVVVRNLLFDLGLLKSKSFDIPVIGIGNLSAGGTGKTPMAEYVLRLLLDNGYHPAMLSRGYNRRSEGYLEVRTDSTALTCGDEPYQVKRKLPQVFVAVCEDRVTGIETILKTASGVDVIVLDDSYQHRKVKPGFNILLTDFNRPYFNDFLLPAGLLREPVSGRSRADIIIVTKSPENIGSEAQSRIRRKLKPGAGQEALFSSLAYQPLARAAGNGPENIDIQSLNEYKAVLFTGIANTRPLEQYLGAAGVTLKVIKFPDHHYFTDADMTKVIEVYLAVDTEHKLLICTEKDWRRLEGSSQAGMLASLPLYYLPVGVKFGSKDKTVFDQKILDYVKTHQRNR